MTDILDQASDLEQLERSSAIAAHVARSAAPVPLCEVCEESRVHINNGLRWRFCADCAEEFLRGRVA